jgi:hypothetical protein
VFPSPKTRTAVSLPFSPPYSFFLLSISATSDAVDHLIDETGSMANQIQARLKKMNDATEDQEENLGPAETRIRKNIHTTLVSKFVEQVQKYQGAPQRTHFSFRASQLTHSTSHHRCSEQI